MNRQEELLQKARQDPAAFVKERIELEDELQQQICVQIQTLAQQTQILAEQTQTIAGHIETIDEQKALIAQLQRLLFGPSSEKMSPEKEAQLAEVANDLQDQAQRPAPDSEEVLAAEEPEEKKKRRRGGRHPMPAMALR